MQVCPDAKPQSLNTKTEKEIHKEISVTNLFLVLRFPHIFFSNVLLFVEHRLKCSLKVEMCSNRHLLLIFKVLVPVLMQVDYSSEELWECICVFKQIRKHKSHMFSTASDCSLLSQGSCSGLERSPLVCFPPSLRERDIINGDCKFIRLDFLVFCTLMRISQSSGLGFAEDPAAMRTLSSVAQCLTQTIQLFLINACPLPHKLESKNDKYCNVEIGSKRIQQTEHLPYLASSKFLPLILQ